VALLGQGRLKEGIEVLEAALEASPSTLAMAEPFLFNLCAFFVLSLSFPEYTHDTFRQQQQKHSYVIRASIVHRGRQETRAADRSCKVER
jgi:hypothetical protein